MTSKYTHTHTYRCISKVHTYTKWCVRRRNKDGIPGSCIMSVAMDRPESICVCLARLRCPSSGTAKWLPDRFVAAEVVVVVVTMAVEADNFGLLRGGCWSPKEVPVDATRFRSLSILSLFQTRVTGKLWTNVRPITNFSKNANSSTFHNAFARANDLIFSIHVRTTSVRR